MAHQPKQVRFDLPGLGFATPTSSNFAKIPEPAKQM
jgi:hypothetical protein